MRTILRPLLAVYDYSALYLCLIWLGFLCLAWTPVALIARPLLPDRWGRALGRFIITYGFRFYLGCLAASQRASFDLKALDQLRDQGPMILAPNHPSLLDAVLVISRLPDVGCVLKASLMNNLFLGAGARLAQYIRNEPLRGMVQQATENFARGSSLLLFPEGTRSTQEPTNPLKGSIGLIAHHAKMPVQTIRIETDSRYLSKGWSLFRKPPMPIRYKVTLGKRFPAPESSQQLMRELRHYFETEMLDGSAFRACDELYADEAAGERVTDGAA